MGVSADSKVDVAGEFAEPGAQKRVASVGVKKSSGVITAVTVPDENGKGNRMGHEEQTVIGDGSFGEPGANGIRLEAGLLEQRIRGVGDVEHIAPAETGVPPCEIIVNSGFRAAGDFEIHGTHGEVVVAIAARHGEAFEMEVAKVEAMNPSCRGGWEPEVSADIFHAGEFRPLRRREPVILIAETDHEGNAGGLTEGGEA